ncbi:radical SAM family heme chaperone HemW [Pinisolibacter aquiterrae]|uniref:radical SAM family heme chaperone HemW n=1 Tax=Pinisolibacter aquiterrae TaxID=2815579 RepID=UPI001C3DBDB5|nr:radical SAM family heme chaperone HemW [Pinisolibacter aquiterrae]MBV5263921.1 coproporphyrinogen III oxidase [Pinisolibacter aquiterrae]MCC8235932.1 radical SAM family heme chaperone HemW [Pinisolibacter aquiterrae]
MITGEPGFGIYVHWPFCASKCPYCDFNSHVRPNGVDQARFAAGLAKELAHFAARVPGRTVGSIFFGGGTPSLMAPKSVETVLEAIAKHWSIDEGVEITLEANPSSADAANFTAYRAAGVNRLSLGVQALNDRDLKRLGRLHDVAEALDAIALARRTFDRMSFDMIYARPDQTVAEWRDELKAAVDLAADHLSVYQLTIEAETRFEDLWKAGKLVLPDHDLAADLWDATHEVLDAAGLPAYETSNHAAPGAESRHNLVYWRYGEYVGVGAGAHGRLVEKGERRATATEKNPEKWLRLVEAHGHGLVDDEFLTREEQGDEYLLMGLRLTEGIDLDRWEEISGRVLDPARLADLEAHGMVETVREGNRRRVRATASGAAVLDAVVADLAA